MTRVIQDGADGRYWIRTSDLHNVREFGGHTDGSRDCSDILKIPYDTGIARDFCGLLDTAVLGSTPGCGEAKRVLYTFGSLIRSVLQAFCHALSGILRAILSAFRPRKSAEVLFPPKTVQENSLPV